MASISRWKQIIEDNQKSFSAKVYTVEDIHDFIRKNNLKSVDSKNTAFHSPLYSIVKGSSKESQESSVSDTLLMNVRIDASNTGNGVNINAHVGQVKDANNSTIKCAAGFISAPKVIQGVALACGFSIGKVHANQIYNKLKSSNFDWGVSAVEDKSGMIQIYCIGVPENTSSSSFVVKTYIEDRLLEMIITQLQNWGLWEEHTPIQSLDPIIGQNIDYQFLRRFPPVPSKYLKRCLQLMNSVNNPSEVFQDNYILASVDSNESITLNVVTSDDRKMDVIERSSKVNDSSQYVEYKELIFKGEADMFGPNTYVHQYTIDANGNITANPNQRVTGRYYNFYIGAQDPVEGQSSSEISYVYDNFGTDYWDMATKDDGTLTFTELKEDLTDITKDDNAVDLRGGQLSTKMPSWWASRLLVSTPDVRQWNNDNPMASYLNETEEYLPIDIPDNAIVNNPSQSDAVTGEHTSSELLDIMIDAVDDVAPYIGLSDDVLSDLEPPITTPATPTLPNGISSIARLYYLDNSQLQSFRNWLWDPTVDVASTFLKIFQSPYDAIIGLHAVFAAPSIGTSGPIILGNLASNVNADVVHQYNDLSCGYVAVKEYFKNINDYTNTQIQLYLPFIGFVQLDTAEVMNKYLYVDYNLDFLTGACIAFVSLKKGLSDDKYVAYQFAGNFACEVPITGTDYSGVIRNVMQAGIGGAIAGPVGAVAGAALNSQVPIQRSGGLGGNIGAMGIRKPYLIITRRPSYDAQNRGHFEGLPQNAMVRLSSQKGYTRIKNINLEGIACTEEEKAMILSKLQGGVII